MGLGRMPHDSLDGPPPPTKSASRIAKDSGPVLPWQGDMRHYATMAVKRHSCPHRWGRRENGLLSEHLCLSTSDPSIATRDEWIYIDKHQEIWKLPEHSTLFHNFLDASGLIDKDLEASGILTAHQKSRRLQSALESSTNFWKNPAHHNAGSTPTASRGL